MKKELLVRDGAICQFEDCSYPKCEFWFGEFTEELVVDVCHLDHNKSLSLKNAVLMHPACHDKFDGRPAKDHLDELGWEMFLICSDYKSSVSARNAATNQLRALERRSHVTDLYHVALLENAEYWNEQVSMFGKLLSKVVKSLSQQDSRLGLVVRYMQQINPVGAVTIGRLLSFLNPYRAKHPSSYAKYCGLAGSSTERYEKGKEGGGSKFLRSALFIFSDNVIKQKASPYNPLYYQAKYDKENDDRSVAEFSKGGKGKTKLVPWNETSKGHRHMHAKRIVNKRFLHDLHIISRQVFGLPVSKPYALTLEGHNDFSPPSDRGWPTPEQVAEDLVNLE